MTRHRFVGLFLLAVLSNISAFQSSVSGKKLTPSAQPVVVKSLEAATEVAMNTCFAHGSGSKQISIGRKGIFGTDGVRLNTKPSAVIPAIARTFPGTYQMAEISSVVGRVELVFSDVRGNCTVFVSVRDSEPIADKVSMYFVPQNGWAAIPVQPGQPAGLKIFVKQLVVPDVLIGTVYTSDVKDGAGNNGVMIHFAQSR